MTAPGSVDEFLADVKAKRRVCPHEEFSAQVNVNRMLDTGRFIAEIHIHCVQCGEKFRFLGVPAGIAWTHPSCSITETELNAPIEPEGETRLQSSASYEMPPKMEIQ